jgi:hypothetical protein
MTTKPPSQLAQLLLWVVALAICLAALTKEGWPYDGPLGLVGTSGIGTSVGGVLATLFNRGWFCVVLGTGAGLFSWLVLLPSVQF